MVTWSPGETIGSRLQIQQLALPACAVQAGQINILILMSRNSRANLCRRLAQLCHAVGVHTLLRASAALHTMRPRKATVQAGMSQRTVAAAVAG